MSEQRKQVVRRFYEEVVNQGQLELIDELVTEDHVNHDPLDPEAQPGRENLRRWVELRRAAFADFHVAIEDEIAEDDRVVTRFTASGTHTGELLGVAATGKRAEVVGIAIDRFVGDRAAESWIVSDALGLLGQLGLVEPQAASPAA